MLSAMPSSGIVNSVIRITGMGDRDRPEWLIRINGMRKLDAVMVLAPTTRDGLRLRKRYGKLRSYLFTFLDYPEVDPDNNSSERELRPTATYRKVTGGFRSNWGADLFASFRSVVGTAARRGIGAYQAIRMTLHGSSVLAPG
jgi:transposase